MYIDEYASCKKTYATLRIYPGDIDPEEVTLRLGEDHMQGRTTVSS